MAGTDGAAVGGVLREVLAAAVDLALPLECGGCGRPGIRWCGRCARAVYDDPVPLTPRVSPGVPVWAAGRYRGPLQRAIVELKEHRRSDLVPVLGSVLARSLLRLAEWEVLGNWAALALVPAPTRTLAARRRGGDPVSAVARAAAHGLGGRSAVVPLLCTAAWARDSAGLSAGRRTANLAGAVSLRRPPPVALRDPRVGVLLIDDVMTTGATAAVAIAVLARHGVRVAGTLVLAGA